MTEVVGTKKHSSMTKMEAAPGLYSIYSKIFLKIMSKNDLQESVQKYGKNYFDVTINKCLWRTACGENECGEFCRLFCYVDNVTYGGLKKWVFLVLKLWGTVEIVVIFIFIKNRIDRCLHKKTHAKSFTFLLRV